MKSNKVIVIFTLIFSLSLFGEVKTNYKILSMSLNSNFTMYEYNENHTKTEISKNASFSENYYELLFGKEDSAEFSVYYKKLQINNIPIDEGTWNIDKTLVGVNFGKVITLNIKIPEKDYRFPVEFSGGFFAQYATKKDYTIISGTYNEEVETGTGSSINYGVYTSIRLRIAYLRERYNVPSIVIGFKYQYPLNEFEYNPDNETISYRLYRNYIYIGLYF